MDVISACSLRVASIEWQPRPGAYVLTVVCKATYVLMPGESPLASEQDAPSEADKRWDDDPRQSLAAAGDLAPFKRSADVLVLGHAYAPQLRPVGSLVARLVVGELRKAIEVFGDRAWTPDGKVEGPAHFVRMPLRWEKAAGGAGTSNPVGVPAGVRPDARGLTPIPNLQPVGARLVSPRDALPPVGFGPIAPQWPERLAKLGRHAGSFDDAALRQRPLPEDIDAAYFNVAPADQQVAELRVNAPILLEHLHPRYSLLETRLREVTPRAVVQRLGPGEQEVPLRCDTMCIDADRGTCTLTWRGSLPCRRAGEWGRVVITMEGDDAAKGPAPMGEGTMQLGAAGPPAGGGRAALPFVQGPQEATAPRPDRIEERPAAETGEPARAVLPFVKPGAGPSPVAPAALTAPAAPAATAATRAISRTIPPPDPEPDEDGWEEPQVDPAQVSIERFATIRAELTEGRASRADVLKQHALAPSGWAEVERYHTAALDEEAERGAFYKRKAYDAAYVAAVEGFRGPITISEYARIVAAMERGKADKVLDELAIHRPALMPILRHWARKTATDAKLACDATNELSAMRKQAR